jgi:hypothetical protein
MSLREKYRTTSTSTLRAYVMVLSKAPLCWLFAEQLADIAGELLERELPVIAEESGAVLVGAVKGMQ